MMTTRYSTFEEAMEGSRLQRFAPDLGLFVTWHGGSMFNVWAYVGHDQASEVDVFTVYANDNGDPGDFDWAVEQIDSHFRQLRLYTCVHCGEELVDEPNPNGDETWRSVEGPWGCLQAAYDRWNGRGDEPPAPYPPHFPERAS